MMELATYTELEIAHRLMTAYTQKCRSLHGHRYQVEITVTAQKFNEDGMIVDFKKFKEVVKTVLDDKWDHGSCFNARDPLAKAVQASGSERVHIINANPTLEWMVEHWALELQVALDMECPGVAVSMLKASETARNTVTWRCNRLPWEISQPANDAKKLICAEKDVRGTLRLCPATDSAAVAVDAFTPTDELEDGESDGSNPDASLYLVQFRTEKMPYSTAVRTALKGKALVERCKEVAQAYVEDIMKNVPGHSTDMVATLLNITKLPG